MILASFENLLALTQQSLFLDRVEMTLRRAGDHGLANDLLRLQQDAGVQIERAIAGPQDTGGLQTARLDKNYTPVTDSRFSGLFSSPSSPVAASFAAPAP